MLNPLMASMTGMSHNNNILQSINMIKSMMNGKSPEAFAQILANKDPRFAQFLRENKGKSPAQIAQENGLNFEQIAKFMK